MISWLNHQAHNLTNEWAGEPIAERVRRRASEWRSRKRWVTERHLQFASVKKGLILTRLRKAERRFGRANRCTKPDKLLTVATTCCGCLITKPHHFPCFAYIYQAFGNDKVFAWNSLAICNEHASGMLNLFKSQN